MSVNSKDLFEILVRENADMLMVYLRSVVRDSHAADDLFQETMLTAWRRLDDYDRSRPIGAWLRGIASKLVLAHRRKSARGMLACDATILDHINSQMDNVLQCSGDTWDDKIAALRECLESLPDGYREAVKLRYEDQLSLPSIGERLALSAEGIKKRLQRARSKLVDCVKFKIATMEEVS